MAGLLSVTSYLLLSHRCSLIHRPHSYEKLPASPLPYTSPYSFVGYSTSYRFLTYVPCPTKPSLQTFTLPALTPIQPSSLPSRARISQFLILPPHQHHSQGTHLFNTMTNTFLSDPTVSEITVEDPNEAFDDLRDYCDYTRLQKTNAFAQISLNTTPPPPELLRKRVVPTSHLLNLDLLESLRKKNKLAPRQFYRLIELYLLSRIPPHKRQSGTARLTQRGKASDADDRAFYYWRLLVKQRVYKKNRDVLMQLEKAERIDKVEQTVGEVAGDYERLLRGLEERAGAAGAGGAVNGGGERGVRRGKRKVIMDNDEEEEKEKKDVEEQAHTSGDDKAQGDGGGAEKPAKRRKGA